jgi:two-component system cell cycle response regulator DivK
MTTVLVVEDNLQNLKLATLVLQKAGYAVLSAASGEAGLRIAREERPELVLMDVQMPGMDGLTVTKLLRGSPETAKMKVIALTALAMKGDAERILSAGFDGYLAKPFQYHELIDLVKRHVS